MSEWNRNRRDEQSGWRSRDDERRDQGRFGGAAGSRETRSFDETGRTYGDQEWLEAQRYGGADYAAYGGSGYPRQGGRGRDYEARLQNPRYDDGRRTYGRPDYATQGYAGQRYGRAGGQTAFGAQNETLRRVADGDDDHGWTGLARHGEGMHRGRGPKNYTRSDERIREDVNDRLSDDSWLDASDIEVQVASCEVTLSGTVGRREDKRRAEDICERISGVKHVQNNLRVQPQAEASSDASGMRTKSATAPTATANPQNRPICIGAH